MSSVPLARLYILDRACRARGTLMEEILYNKVIGIDVHQSKLVCCAVWHEDNERKTEKMTFGTFKNDKKAMAAWCASFHPDLVIMESTGIYWMSPFAFLEKIGIRAAVVNARQVKQMEGKKTDMGDAEWLAHIGRLGTFTRSFIPPVLYREIRIHTRYVLKLTDALCSEKNRFHKVLAHAGFNLSVVFSDLHGVSASRCVEGIMAGLSTDEIMKTLKVSRLKKASPEQIRDALDGELTENYRIILRDIQEHIDFLQKQIEKIHQRISSIVRDMHPHALCLLQTIPGISEKGAVRILIELGGEDMTFFKAAKSLAAWIGVCPGNNESAGKRKHGHIRKGNYYLRRVLCECAHASVRTKGTSFQSKYQSKRSKKGNKRALITIVHNIVRMIYLVLSKKTPYRDPQIDYVAESAQKNLRRWIEFAVNDPNWEIQATNLVTGEVLQSERLTLSA